MHDEQECELFLVDGVNSGDENALFGEAVNNDENCSETAREGQLFDDIESQGCGGAERGFRKPYGLCCGALPCLQMTQETQYDFTKAWTLGQ